jgi:hypothetical protein
MFRSLFIKRNKAFGGVAELGASFEFGHIVLKRIIRKTFLRNL